MHQIVLLLRSTDSGLLSPGAGPTGNRPLLGQSPNVSRFSTPGTAKKSLSELLNEWSTKNVHNDMEDKCIEEIPNFSYCNNHDI